MNNNWNDYDELTGAVMDEALPDESRDRILQSLLSGARRRRRRRRMGQVVGASITILVVSLVVLQRWLPFPMGSSAPSQMSEMDLPASDEPVLVKGTGIRVISDDELFAMLGDRPFALLGSAEHPRLVLLGEEP